MSKPDPAGFTAIVSQAVQELQGVHNSLRHAEDKGTPEQLGRIQDASGRITAAISNLLATR